MGMSSTKKSSSVPRQKACPPPPASSSTGGLCGCFRRGRAEEYVRQGEELQVTRTRAVQYDRYGNCKAAPGTGGGTRATKHRPTASPMRGADSSGKGKGKGKGKAKGKGLAAQLSQDADSGVYD
jgi:hypothetical protein